MIVEIQVLPRPSGTADEAYRHVDAAIAEIQASGLSFEVGGLGTTIEGEPDALWPLARRVHEACLASGADSVITILKLAQAADEAAGPTVADLTSKFRNGS